MRAALARIPVWIRGRRFPAPGRIVTICLLADPRDRLEMEAVARRDPLDVRFAAGPEDALRVIRGSSAQIIVFDRDLASAGWRADMTSFAAACPGVCIILVSRVVDDALWSEVVSNGGYEVLPKPLRENELLRATRLARSYLARTAGAMS